MGGRTGEDKMEAVRLPITDNIDLHTFRPREVPDLLEDYFTACIEEGITVVRVIHGKGHGILKKRVRSILKKSLLVSSYRNASPEEGGWGATMVCLKKSTQTRHGDR